MYDFEFSYLAKSQVYVQTFEAAMKAIWARLDNWLSCCVCARFVVKIVLMARY